MGPEDMVLTVVLPAKSSATAYIKATLVPEKSSVTLFEASKEEKDASKAGDLVLVGDNVYGLSAFLGNKTITDFTLPAQVDIKYTGAQAGNYDQKGFYITRYDRANRQWQPVASAVSVPNKTVTAYLSKLDLFALAYYPEPPKFAPDNNNGGLVAGATSGVYPNGTLLRVAGQAAVWRIVGGQKSLVPSADIFNSQFIWQNVIELPSDKQLGFYERAADTNFAVGSLLKAPNSPAIYRFSQAGGLQPILSNDVFKSRGYCQHMVKMVSTETIKALPMGAEIIDGRTIYPGDLLKISDGPTVWRIQSDGAAHYFPNENIFYQYALSFKRVWTILRSRMEQVADRVTKMFYPDGVLVRGSGNTVYVVSDGQKRPIASAADFNALLYKWENVKVMPDADLNVIPTGAEIKVISQ